MPNTAAGAQLTSAPSCAGAATGACRRLALAATPGDDPAAALARLWSPRGPQEDLASALDALGTAGTASAAAAARDEAIAILEGRALPGRAYDGIPLLNWDAPRRVRTVPAGGTVDVTEVRFGDHVATDTWLLRFEDPSRPFSIRYHVSELEGTYGGDLAPAPLLADGEVPIGGVQSVDQPLGVHGLRTGTSVASRFTDARGMPAAGAEERTLTGVQEVVVRMPPAKAVTAILESGARTGATASLAPATDDRLAAATTAFGFTGTTPTDAERRTAIGRIAAAAPERQIWDALDALDTADLAAAHAAGTQLAPLVSTMRARGAIPAGVPRDASADVTVVLQNSETYVSRGSMRLAAGGSLRVQVVNRDGFARRIEATSLHTSRRDLGPLAWGTFDWARLATGEDTAIPAGGARIVTLRPRDDAFAVWLGDPASGSQAGTVLQLDRGPRTESIAVGDVPGAQPVHAALDAQGRLWTTLSGIDEVVRITPSADLSASTRERYLIPGGAHTTTSTAPLLAPGDIAVDHRGIVWMTLAGGNAIGRIDPARTRDGTGDGIRVYPLNACGVHECAVPFPADPRDVVPSREPLQMDVSSDGQGGTAVWFTEAAADKVGVLHVAADGTLLDRADMSCGCGAPAGIALDAAGDVWFTEEITNRIGRLTPGITNPYGSAGIRLRHYDIPSGVETLEPELSRVAIVTSVPHSVALDRNGLIWFTESATGKVGALDPDRAVPGTTQGMTEITVPVNEFGGEAVPADLVVDRSNTIIWSDEYGDQIGTVNAGGARADWAPGRSFRPAARRSLTDSPLASPNGDLFFVELGANLLTRVAGVTAGLPGPAAPPVIEASPSEGRLSGTGLQETTSIGVTVRRGGDVVARVDAVPVTAGAFRTSVALRAGDVVTLAPRGAQPNPPLQLTVATLTARADATGRITGHALQAGEPLAGKVGLDGRGRRDDRPRRRLLLGRNGIGGHVDHGHAGRALPDRRARDRTGPHGSERARAVDADAARRRAGRPARRGLPRPRLAHARRPADDPREHRGADARLSRAARHARPRDLELRARAQARRARRARGRRAAAHAGLAQREGRPARRGIARRGAAHAAGRDGHRPRHPPGDAPPGERRAGRAARRAHARATRIHHPHARSRSRTMTRIAALAGTFLAAACVGWIAARPASHPPAAPTASAAQLRAAADRAVALVDDPRRFGYRLVLAPARRDMRGRVDPRARTITLFVDPHDATHRIAHDLAHELGHAYDLAHMTKADRAAYLRRRGVPGAAWWPSAESADYAVGAGDFAETFALCHAASPEFRSRLAAQPADPCGMLPRDARTRA